MGIGKSDPHGSISNKHGAMPSCSVAMRHPRQPALDLGSHSWTGCAPDRVWERGDGTKSWGDTHQVFSIDQVAVLSPLRAIRHLVKAAQVGPGDDGGAVLAIPDIEAGAVGCVRQVKLVLLGSIIRVGYCHTLVKLEACMQSAASDERSGQDWEWTNINQVTSKHLAVCKVSKQE